MNFIIETNWRNRETRKGINEYYQSLEQACDAVDGVKLIGLFEPLNETWNWTHFIKVDDLEQWRSVAKETRRLYTDFNYNVTYSMSRIYLGSDQARQPPPIKDPDSLKYLVMDIGQAVGVTGLEYYRQKCEQFEGLEGVGLLGVFLPLTESWNYALIKLYDSLRRYVDVDTEYVRQQGGRSAGLGEGIISSVERIYERYES
jgi:hypothetical protein